MHRAKVKTAASRLQHTKNQNEWNRRRAVRGPCQAEKPWYDGGPGTPALPGEPCRTPPHPDWTENEKWAWEKICRGEVADFNSEEMCNACPLTMSGLTWTQDEIAARQISVGFIITVLSLDPWKSSIGDKLFKLSGAFIKEEFKLKGIKIANGIILNGCQFAGKVKLVGVKIDGAFEMQGSCFLQTVKFYRLMVQGIMLINNIVICDGNSLFERLQVGNSVFLRNAKIPNGLRMIYSSVGGNLQICGATIRKLNLSGTKINGELMFNYSRFRKPFWLDGGELILRNVYAENVTGAIDSWPSKMILNGFIYRFFQSGSIKKQEEVYRRPTSWFVELLARQATYMYQPYEQCAKVLREAGQPEKANAVLFAGKERERESLRKPDNWPGWRWLGQTFLRYTIGYGLGYRYFQSLIWAGLLIFIGAVVFASSDANWPKSIQYCYAYSLDMVLPLIQLTKAHYDEVYINGWQRYYFYFHQLAGYVLASVVVAGLAGILRK